VKYPAATVNTIGLILTIAGCWMLVKFGLPPDFDPLGRSYLLLEEDDKAMIAKGNKYRFRGRLGLGLIIGGSLLQIVASWLPASG
jgi:hypothetical protein